MIEFKNDNGRVFVRPSAVAGILSESKTISRIWLSGGGSFVVHGSAEGVVKQIMGAAPEPVVEDSY